MDIKNVIRSVAFLFLVTTGTTAVSQSGDVSAPITVDGIEYYLYQKNGHALVIPSSVQIDLTRNASVGLPPCDFLYDQLTTWDYRIDECNEGLGTVDRCARIGGIIDNLRTYETDFVSPRVTQYWSYNLQEIVVSDSVLQKVATRQELAPNHVHAPAEIITDNSSPTNFAIVLAPIEDSWPARVATIVDLNSPPVAYYEASQTFVTNDHLAACGLIEGSLYARWTQPIRVKVALGDVQPPPLSADELWAVYQELLTKEDMTAPEGFPPEVWRVLSIGWNICAVLEELNLNDNDVDSATMCQYIVENLYDIEDDDMSLLLDLAEEDFVDEVSVIEFDVTVFWRGVFSDIAT